ncbi:hypothetical protein Tco_1142321 [Tanacetum coccineum]
MAWRQHDANIADLFPKPSEYNEQDAARLREVAISLHKPYNSLLYVAGLCLVWKESGHVPILKGPKGEALETYLSTPATRLEDIPPKTVEMETAEVTCRKVLSDRENKKRNIKAKAAAKADGNDDVHQEGVLGKKRVGGVGAPRKKRETHIGTPLVDANLEQVSSPTPINYSDDVPSSPAQRPPLRARMGSSPKLCLRAFE